jgi:NADH-quinone oxidoreductase subunit M
VFAAIALLTIILGAVYILNMIQKVFYGNTNTLTAATRDIGLNEKLVLGVIVVLIFVLGVYPHPLLNLTNGFVDNILKEVNIMSVAK